MKIQENLRIVHEWFITQKSPPFCFLNVDVIIFMFSCHSFYCCWLVEFLISRNKWGRIGLFLCFRLALMNFLTRLTVSGASALRSGHCVNFGQFRCQFRVAVAATMEEDQFTNYVRVRWVYSPHTPCCLAVIGRKKWHSIATYSGVLFTTRRMSPCVRPKILFGFLKENAGKSRKMQ